MIYILQAAWDEMKQQVIEEKLERLGVERGSGSNVPHIFAPHARAASVMSFLLEHVSAVPMNLSSGLESCRSAYSPLQAQPTSAVRRGVGPEFSQCLAPATIWIFTFSRE